MVVALGSPLLLHSGFQMHLWPPTSSDQVWDGGPGLIDGYAFWWPVRPLELVWCQGQGRASQLGLGYWAWSCFLLSLLLGSGLCSSGLVLVGPVCFFFLIPSL